MVSKALKGNRSAVVAALVITAISALISVGAIVIDQLHFNNQTYRDDSQQFRVNQQLIDQNINLQKQIDDIRKTK